MTDTKRIEQILGLVILFLLVAGCFLVLRPFIAAILWACILCFASWPLYARIERWLSGRPTLAASLMTLLIALVLVGPFVIVGFSLANKGTTLLAYVRELLSHGLPDPPEWVAKIPLVGAFLEGQWQQLAHDSGRVGETLGKLFASSRSWLIERGVDIGQAVAQLSLSVFIAFFLYRDGIMVVNNVQDAIKRVIGDRTQHLLALVGDTIKGVVYGILGTALAQGILAGFGFWIAGVPGAPLLGLLTFFLSLVPMGPPLVWIPATIWLFYQQKIGWAIFLAVWGAGVVSTIDNFLKPYLISRGSSLPFVYVFLGVLGGIIAFGFIGVFIGPTLLAVGNSLVQEWIAQKKASPEPPAAARTAS